MPIKQGLTDEAREYLQLLRREELDRLKRQINSKRHAAEQEAMEHERLILLCSAKLQKAKRTRVDAADITAALETPTLNIGGAPLSSPCRPLSA